MSCACAAGAPDSATAPAAATPAAAMRRPVRLPIVCLFTVASPQLRGPSLTRALARHPRPKTPVCDPEGLQGEARPTGELELSLRPGGTPRRCLNARPAPPPFGQVPGRSPGRAP